MGGLTDVGFSRRSDLLLVFSSQGRGVFDCTSGERVARDNDVEAAYAAYDSKHHECKGIGPIADEVIPLTGEGGGGLLRGTDDGWSVDPLTLAWPKQHLLIFSDWAEVCRLNKPIHKLAIETELRAFGFSPTGRSLVIATSSDVTIYGRQVE